MPTLERRLATLETRLATLETRFAVVESLAPEPDAPTTAGMNVLANGIGELIGRLCNAGALTLHDAELIRVACQDHMVNNNPSEGFGLLAQIERAVARVTGRTG